MSRRSPNRTATRRQTDPLKTGVDTLRHEVLEIDLSDPDDITLRHLGRVQRAALKAIDLSILRLRARGYSFGDIGAALGVSAQAAHQRFHTLSGTPAINHA